MPNKWFSPGPGRLGYMPVILTPGILVTGTLAAGTLTFHCGGYPGAIPSNIIGASISAETFPTAATSITVRLIKRDISAAADVALTDLVSINAGTARTRVLLPFLSTLSDIDLLLAADDTLRLEMVTTGAVSVQPVGLLPVVELSPTR